MMNVLDTRVNALSNEIAGTSESLHDVQLQMDMVREDLATNQEQIANNEQRIQDLTDAQVAQRSEIQNLRDQFSARHAALLNGTISELIRRIETLEQNTNQNPNDQASNQLSDLEVRQWRTDRQRQEDKYFLTTIMVVGFANPQANVNNNREAARDILSSIGSEDILHDVEKINFFRSPIRQTEHETDL